MSKWVIDKIIAFLQAKQGFTIESSSKEKILTQDAMGFRYEITVRNLGRTLTWTQKDQNQNLSKEQLKQIREMIQT